MKSLKQRKRLSMIMVLSFVFMVIGFTPVSAKYGERGSYTFDSAYTKDVGKFYVATNLPVAAQTMMLDSNVYHGASGKSAYIPEGQHMRYDDLFKDFFGGTLPAAGTRLDVTLWVRGETGYQGNILVNVINSTGTATATAVTDTGWVQLTANLTCGSSTGALKIEPVSVTSTGKGFYVDDVMIMKYTTATDTVGQLVFDDCESMLEVPFTVGGGAVATNVSLDASANHTTGGTGKSLKFIRSATAHRVKFDLFTGNIATSTIRSDSTKLGKVFEISAWLKTSSDSTVKSGNFMLSVIDSTNTPLGGSRSDNVMVSDTGWTQIKTAYFVPSADSAVTIAIEQPSGASVVDRVNIDDVRVTEKNTYTFNDIYSAISLSGTFANTNVSDPNLLTLSTTVDRSGGAGKSLFLQGRTTAAHKISVYKGCNNMAATAGANITAGKKYDVSAWVLIPSTSNNAAVTAADFVLEVADNSASANYTKSAGVNVTKGVWTKLNMTYTVPVIGVNNVTAPAGIVVDQPTGATVVPEFYVDDISVIPVETHYTFDTDTSVDANFRTDSDADHSSAIALDSTYYNGANGKSLRLSGRNTAGDGVKFLNPFSKIAFNGDKKYQISMAVMATDANGTSVSPFFEYEDGSINLGEAIPLMGGVWKKITFSPGMHSSPYSIGIRQKAGEPVLSALYIDDISVQEIAGSTYDPTKLETQISFSDGGSKAIANFSGAVGIKGVTAKATVSNFLRQTGKNSTLIIAVYSGDGNLKDVSMSPTVALQSGNLVPAENLEATSNTVIQTGDVIKAFLWDDMGNLIPVVAPAALQ